MDILAKHALIRSLYTAYKQASKKTRSELLNHVVLVTGYHRWYASKLLRHPRLTPKKKAKRIRRGTYQQVLIPLIKLWKISNYASGKRLVGMLPSYMETLTRDGQLFLTERQNELLLTISAATIERYISPQRKRVFGRGKTTTKPGTLLKSQIPIHVFTRWDERKPGFGEIDLVAHCGASVKGTFAYTVLSSFLCKPRYCSFFF